MNDPPAVDVAAWRRARRRELIAARLAFGGPAQAAASRVIEGYLDACLAVPAGEAIGFYWPMRGEFDPRPFIERLAAAGHVVALPVVAAGAGPLAFRRWQPGAAMVEDRYGIPTPAEGAAVVPELLLVPLLGFDAAGYRLGYGAGHYDRTLAALQPPPRSIGVGFALGRLATIHPQPHDRPLDCIVTEEGVFERAGAGPLVRRQDERLR